jgi:DNA-binding NarL/FixJ family response regulator
MAEELTYTAVILDPHPLWTEALPPVLLRAGVRTVAKANAPASALALLHEHNPDVFLTSLEMPEGEADGMAVIGAALERLPTLKVIVFSMHEDLGQIETALSAGVAAYVTKAAHPDDLAAAIRQAFDPSIYLASDRLGSRARAAAVESGATLRELTRRELEILTLMAGGRTNAQLARALWVTEQTVKFHLSNVYRKLGVANRTEASHWAHAHGLLGT